MRSLARMARQMLQEVQAGAIRPVQIVQQQGERALLGERLQESRHLPEEALLRVPVVQLERESRRSLFAAGGGLPLASALPGAPA